jgi:hypothetical protein
MWLPLFIRGILIVVISWSCHEKFEAPVCFSGAFLFLETRMNCAVVNVNAYGMEAG